jgi:hypothetical protein
MKLISSNVGRCVKLFAWEEVRPLHGINSSLLAEALAEQFNFQVRPSAPILPDTVVKFAEGLSNIGGTLIAIKKFDIYSDGFAVDCSNTDDAKIVADEIFRWAQTDLGYRDFVRPPKLIFLSLLTVEFAPEFENLFKGWKKLQKLLNNSAHPRYGFSQDINVQRMQWRGDPHTVVNNTLVSDFWIERKVGEPFSSNRWHCQGVLPTDEWIELLQKIENLAIAD